ncbi:nuclear transport factor 2 family protein [Nocardia sp. CA2R105]|uniref:nuclear transport factor 2 family protein n=1 Tax=Nocardia coffeae TaxID=2873381 RepID=UPI001CA7035A|nr:nuclear transport factor 2 family protein [Nocardia coffeae]MBY8854952.1 nuclear transport factor 2 family protein [Nocardia coffeae]
MDRTVVVRYRTRDDARAENRRLIEEVFAQLHREQPAEVTYCAFELGDSGQFVHTATAADGALSELDSFRRFQREIGSRVVNGPEAQAATVIGAYRPAPASVPIAVAFVEAFGRRDLLTVTAMLHDDVVFDGPRTHLTGAADVSAAIGKFAEAVTGVEVIDAFGEDDRVLVVYDMHTGPFGTLRTVDHITVRGDRIAADTVVFDTARLPR